MSRFHGFVTCRASPCVEFEDVSGAEHNWKLKFRMQTHLADINTIFEYYHASVNLDNVDVLYLEYEHVKRHVLKNKTATIFDIIHHVNQLTLAQIIFAIIL